MGAECCICVFAKPPVAGEVKTRLARAVGSAQAAHLAHQFLLDTWGLLLRIRWAEPILASPRQFPRSLRPPGARLWLQGRGDLGARLERIFRRALRSFRMVIVIGSDTPGLPTTLLTQARRELSNNAEAAIGPTEDGGFYLLALTRCPPRLLAQIAWSSSSTFAQTLRKLRENRLRAAILEPWFDVDRFKDLERLSALIRCGALRAARTERLLKRWGVGQATKGIGPRLG